MTKLVCHPEQFTLTQLMKSELAKIGEPVMIGLDIETTGFDERKEVILSIAVTLIDKELTQLDKGFEIIVNQPQSIIDGMDDWCKKTHGENGLIDKVLSSPYSLMEAEQKVISYLNDEYKRLGVESTPLPMMGNSIFLDRAFINYHTPKLANLFHYRGIDVSSIKELVRFMRPELYFGLEKSQGHTALADIVESLEELIIYREHFFQMDK